MTASRDEPVSWANDLVWMCLLASGWALADVLAATTRAALPWSTWPWVWLCSASALTMVGVTAHVLRVPLVRWARHAPLRRALVGGIEGALLCAFLVMFERNASWSARATYAFVAVVVVAKLVFAVWPRDRRLRNAARLALCVACVVGGALVPWRQKPWLRIGLELTFLLALLEVVHTRVLSMARARALAGVLGLALSGPLVIVGSPLAWSTLIQLTSASRATWYLVAMVAPPLVPPQGTPLGPRSCEKPRECIARDATLPTPLHGKAAGADVLILSLDALRWDHAHALSGLWKELGPHVRFTRAISPSSGTKLSLGSLIRGRPVRRVPFSKDVLYGGVQDGGPATLGAMLAAQGYRAVHVPTQRFFDPRAGLTRGFEISFATGPEVFNLPGNGNHTVSAARALNHALSLARATPQPLLFWTHAIESHYPYGKHGDTRAGQLAALRELDRVFVSFVRRYRALKRGRPLVIAVLGDHGEEFGEHGGRHHSTTVRSEVTRVGFALAGPGLPPGRVDAPVSTAAPPATLLEWLGLPVPCSVDVPSVLGCAASGVGCPTLAESYVGKHGGAVAYTGPRHRLIHSLRFRTTQLFDWDEDRYELRDLALPPVSPSSASAREALEAQATAFDGAHCVAAQGTAAED